MRIAPGNERTGGNQYCCAVLPAEEMRATPPARARPHPGDRHRRRTRCRRETPAEAATARSGPCGRETRNAVTSHALAVPATPATMATPDSSSKLFAARRPAERSRRDAARARGSPSSASRARLISGSATKLAATGAQAERRRTMSGAMKKTLRTAGPRDGRSALNCRSRPCRRASAAAFLCLAISATGRLSGFRAP